MRSHAILDPNVTAEQGAGQGPCEPAGATASIRHTSNTAVRVTLNAQLARRSASSGRRDMRMDECPVNAETSGGAGRSATAQPSAVRCGDQASSTAPVASHAQPAATPISPAAAAASVSAREGSRQGQHACQASRQRSRSGSPIKVLAQRTADPGGRQQPALRVRVAVCSSARYSGGAAVLAHQVDDSSSTSCREDSARVSLRMPAAGEVPASCYGESGVHSRPRTPSIASVTHGADKPRQSSRTEGKAEAADAASRPARASTRSSSRNAARSPDSGIAQQGGTAQREALLPVEDSALESGEELVGYSIGERIGQGGFCQVLAGVHLASGRPVAVKVIDKVRVLRAACTRSIGFPAFFCN